MSDKRLWTIIGVIISGTLGWLALRNLDWQAIQEAIYQLQVLPWVPMAILSYLAGHVVRGLRCKLLISMASEISLLTSSNIVASGYAVNNVLPARLGELVRIALLSDVSGIPMSQSLTVVFVERVLDGIIMIFLALLACWVLAAKLVSGYVLALLAVVFGSCFGGIVIVVIAPGSLISVVTRLGEALPESWHIFLYRIGINVCRGVDYLRNPFRFLFLFMLSLVVWLLEAGMFVFLLPGFGLPFNFLWAVFVMSVTNLGILLPSTPGFIGTFHFFCITALVALGVATETATVYAVGAHLSFFIPITIWGLGALGFYVGNWGAMIAAAIGARKLPSLSEALRLEASDTVKTIPSEAIDPPSRFLVALVEALVPFEEAPGILENDQRIVKEVASFVHGQIQTLPKKLLGLFSLGMLFFRAWVRIRHFHGFCLLPLQLRQGIVNNWAFGRVALLRQLFRPVHSLVILGFFENEEVKALLK